MGMLCNVCAIVLFVVVQARQGVCVCLIYKPQDTNGWSVLDGGVLAGVKVWGRGKKDFENFFKTCPKTVDNWCRIWYNNVYL